ncbi:MAG: Rrf2 family transcriptional regulator [Bacteroidota bacterium]|nr:Rrf2 family transcriptional regulator [Bacteroidota bacterium]
MLSKKTKYSLQALAKLAREYGKGPILISEIAQSEGIPQRFLEGILLELKKLGILGSRIGKAGGYYLIKKPEEINLSDIIRSIEGPIALLPCVSEKFYQPCENCQKEEECKIRTVFKNIRDTTYEILKKTSLKDLI